MSCGVGGGGPKDAALLPAIREVIPVASLSFFLSHSTNQGLILSKTLKRHYVS